MSRPADGRGGAALPVAGERDRAAGPVSQAFRDTIVRLHRRLGGEPAGAALVGEWARRVWDATAEGHVCVQLPTGGDDAAALRAALASSPAVSDDPCVREAPLVTDLDGLYLLRWWRAEVRLAAALSALDRPAPVAPPERVGPLLDRLFPGVDAQDGQRTAVRVALERRLAVVTGGPGTGKTTTLARLLVAFLTLHPEARVAFAAPTGKAAARLAHSLSQQLPALDPDGALRARLPSSGVTVHRLLASVTGRAGDPAGSAPLGVDLVIVDEASMLDLEIASRLAEAMPAQGRLVLAGDRDQLASVEAGAVFAELCASRVGGIARLERNYRQLDAPWIARLAAALRDGDVAQVLGSLAGDAGPAADPHAGLRVGAPDTPASVARDALDGYAPAIEAVVAGADPREVLARFDRYRVLCAMREGELGALGVSQAIAAGVRRRVGAPPGAPWYPGRLVMVTRNAPDLGLFNGDVGVCLPLPVDPGAGEAGAGPLAVAFDAGGDVRWFPVLQVPPCEDAFAITVHKSQGSEFDCAACVLAPPGHPLNTRELVYTAVTRARRRLVLWARPAAIADAAARRTTRHGRLADRLDG